MIGCPTKRRGSLSPAVFFLLAYSQSSFGILDRLWYGKDGEELLRKQKTRGNKERTKGRIKRNNYNIS